jgi:uncharacterized membrane protein
LNRTHLFLLALTLALATALRAYHLSDLGYWTDELCTLSDANGHGLELIDVPADRIAPPLPVRTRLVDAAPVSQIMPQLRRSETHPPLYFLLLRTWESALGDGEAAVRSLDVCFSVAAVALLFFAARPDVGASAALWACLVMAVASPQVAFAQEARDYAPVLAFSLAAAIAQRRLIDRPTVARAAVLAGCLLAMMLTHYYAAGVAVALAVHAAVTARGRPLAAAGGSFAGAAVAFALLWLPAFVHQLPLFHSNAIVWLTDPAPGHRWRVFLALCRLPIRWVADVRSPSVAWAGVLLALLPVAYVVRPRLRLWVLWLTIPTAAVAATDLLQSTTQLTLIRYTVFATPAAYVLIGAVGGRFGNAAPAVATLLALLALPNAYVPAWKIDLRTPVQAIGRRLGPGDGLVISGPDRVFDAVTFAAFQHYLPRMPDATALLTRPADRPTLDRLRQCPHTWVVWMWPDRAIETFLPGYRVDEEGQLPSFGELATGQVVAPATPR